MKKYLLCAATLFAGVCANAQESYVPDFAAIGLNGETTTAVVAGPMGENAFNWGAGADDSYKTGDLKVSDNYIKVTINGVDFVTGCQGSTNPKNADSKSLPEVVSGAFFQFTVPEGKGALTDADGLKYGYMYLPVKLTYNKQYAVQEEGVSVPFEVIAGSELLGLQTYTNDAWVDGEAVKFLNEFVTLPEGYNSGKDDNADAGTRVYKENAVAVIKVPVWDGCTYKYNAFGSKVTACGYYYSPDGQNVAISVSEAGGVDGITSIESEKVNANAPIYNLAGQKVSKNAKGILIQNGKKFIR